MAVFAHYGDSMNSRRFSLAMVIALVCVINSIAQTETKDVSFKKKKVLTCHVNCYAASAWVTVAGGEDVGREMVQELVLSDQWEGTARYIFGETPIRMIDGRFCMGSDRGISVGKFCTGCDGSISVRSERIIDEGRGRLRVRIGSRHFFGIYRQEANKLLICLQATCEGYPFCFKFTNETQVLIVLHRITSSNEGKWGSVNKPS